MQKRYSLFMEERWHELFLSSEPCLLSLSDVSKEARNDPLSIKLIQSVKSKIKDGEISRTANILTSAGVAPFSEATIQQLQKKHPPCKEDCSEIP